MSLTSIVEFWEEGDLPIPKTEQSDEDWWYAHAPELEPDDPVVYFCEDCQTTFWDGERRGHYFNGDEIICPAEDDEDGY